MTSAFRTVEMSDPAFELEGLRFATVKSPALRRRGDVCLWVPDAREIGTLLILLHGVYGSDWAWAFSAGAHRTAQRMLAAGEIAPMVIAMPSDGLCRDGSGYLTHPHGEDVERWIVEEVPAIARMAAPALRPDGRIAIAGLSMGGYGAIRLGARRAERFSSISAHSAVTDIDQMQGFVEEPLEDYLACAPREELSALYWLRRNRDRLPKLRFDCGRSDPLIEDNRALHSALDREGIEHTYEEFAGGHDWSYWRGHVASTLRFANQA